jgi:hypothetical protein
MDNINTSSAMPLPAVTFVVNDAGETNAFKPVMQVLHARDIPYAVIASETSQQLLPDDHRRVVKFDPKTDRFVKNETTLQQALQAPVAVVGVSSQKEAFWADWFKQHGSRVIGYVDNLSATQLARPFRTALSTVWVPTVKQAATMTATTGLPTQAVGQPALDAFPAEVARYNRQALRNQLGLPAEAKVIVWAGGYGPGYAQAFEQFLSTLSQDPSLVGVIALHPKQPDGMLERQLMTQYPAIATRCHVLPNAWPIAAATAVADTVAMHDSTVGVQAWLAGKPVVGFGDITHPDALAGQPRFTRVTNNAQNNLNPPNTVTADMDLPSNSTGIMVNNLYAYKSKC